MVLKPALQQKRITASCSIVFSITIYDTDKTDKLHQIVNMYLTVSGSSWNLTCVERSIYWWTFPSFMEITLLVHFCSVIAKLTEQTLYIARCFTSLFSRFVSLSSLFISCWGQHCVKIQRISYFIFFEALIKHKICMKYESV